MDQTDIILHQAEQEYGVDLMTNCRFCGKLLMECECLDLELGGIEDEIEIVEEDIIEESILRVPSGWVIWIDCNHDGCIFLGPKENMDYHDINGYAPSQVTWKTALHFISKENWNLEICKALGESEREEIKEYRERWEK